MSATTKARLAEAPELVFGRAIEDLKIKTGLARSVFKLDKADWAADLDAGVITFTSRKIVARAPVQVIGTYNTRDGTWLWGWDHPSVPAPMARAAQLMKSYGERHGLEQLTTRKIEISQDEAWRLTAVASYLTEAQGAYRGPSGPTLVFMTFGDVTLEGR